MWLWDDLAFEYKMCHWSMYCLSASVSPFTALTAMLELGPANSSLCQLATCEEALSVEGAGGTLQEEPGFSSWVWVLCYFLLLRYLASGEAGRSIYASKFNCPAPQRQLPEGSADTPTSFPVSSTAPLEAASQKVLQILPRALSWGSAHVVPSELHWSLHQFPSKVSNTPWVANRQLSTKGIQGNS